MDKTLVNKYLVSLQNGNINALDGLYKHTKQAVFSVSLSVVKNYQDACDLMQTTYIKVKEKIHLYKPNTNGLAWILTITKNISINEIKKLSRSVVTDFNENEFLGEDIDTYDKTPIFKICKKVLKTEELQILLLHVVAGYKHREIAVILDKPLGTVLWVYNNSLKKLKKSLGFKNEE